jgi:hypothetical protein
MITIVCPTAAIARIEDCLLTFVKFEYEKNDELAIWKTAHKTTMVIGSTNLEIFSEGFLNAFMFISVSLCEFYQQTGQAGCGQMGYLCLAGFSRDFACFAENTGHSYFCRNSARTDRLSGKEQNYMGISRGREFF